MGARGPRVPDDPGPRVGERLVRPRRRAKGIAGGTAAHGGANAASSGSVTRTAHRGRSVDRPAGPAERPVCRAAASVAITPCSADPIFPATGHPRRAVPCARGASFGVSDGTARTRACQRGHFPFDT